MDAIALWDKEAFDFLKKENARVHPSWFTQWENLINKEKVRLKLYPKQDGIETSCIWIYVEGIPVSSCIVSFNSLISFFEGIKLGLEISK
jgi:hypothetical protein